MVPQCANDRHRGRKRHLFQHWMKCVTTPVYPDEANPVLHLFFGLTKCILTVRFEFSVIYLAFAALRS